MTQGRLAFLFPGQGSQSVGMLADLAADYPQVTDTFTEASDVLGRDLWSLVCDGPEDTLNQTENTQPAMLAAGVAVWRCWQARDGALPAAMAGHSLGEYTALVCAGRSTSPTRYGWSPSAPDSCSRPCPGRGGHGSSDRPRR
jgi:[acyl-carrier-protein] S-malonyltransferase